MARLPEQIPSFPPAPISFIRAGIEVVGIRYGYSNLIDYTPAQPLVEGVHYMRLTEPALRRTRSKEGILIGTARANPGKNIKAPADLHDAEKVAPMKRVDEALRSIGVDALVSIGGDDTLKTANKFKLFQELLPAGQHRIPVVHVPKTIDNDYSGIDFTFGYFTAVETLGTEIRNLHADAEAARAYFVVECMGRSARLARLRSRHRRRSQHGAQRGRHHRRIPRPRIHSQTQNHGPQ